MIKTVVLILSLCQTLASSALAEEAHASLLNGTPLPFYIYRGYKSPENHFTPSGWMGDYGDIHFDDHYVDAKNKTSHPAIRIAYTAKASQGNGWAGIYWQNPANNWGSRPGGYNLNGARRLRFLARGEKGDEIIAEFKVGGITGTYSDSGSAAIGPVTLTREWKQYNINMDNQELSSISGGFCWTLSRTDNPQGAVFYLDDIHFE